MQRRVGEPLQVPLVIPPRRGGERPLVTPLCRAGARIVRTGSKRHHARGACLGLGLGLGLGSGLGLGLGLGLGSSVPLSSASQPSQRTAPPRASAVEQLGTLSTGLPHGRTSG